MYHETVQKLAEAIVQYIRKEQLLKPGDRLGLAVSGGADSVALLRLMVGLRKDLGIVLSVVHFNHKLRGADAEADEEFVKELALQDSLELFRESGNAARHRKEEDLSLEAAARDLRYRYFVSLLRTGTLNRVATAHTLDDQAETVLLKLTRGAGTRGLAGIYPRLPINNDLLVAGSRPPADTENFIIRPLLGIRRKSLESYLNALGQDWREDKSNRDLRHSRNVVRHGILPRLERNLNPGIREVLAETAEISRAEEQYWSAQVVSLLPQVWKSSDAGGALNLNALLTQPLALQRRLIRAAPESLGFQLEFKHVEQVLQLSLGRHQRPQSVILPGDWIASRSADEVQIKRRAEPQSLDYEYRLPVPGKVTLHEAGKLIEALLVGPDDESGYNPEHAFDPALLGKELWVRNWRPGDRFWPGHSKSPKKVKELLQQRHLTGTTRKLYPVVVSGIDVIWLRDFPAPSALRPRDSKREVVIIRERAIETQ
jgi:tRNA(Ile)-lysidine synthase